eukprot:TRINITY_DN130_c0_g2_i3.p1 TRINITY_DN130_c0_g2~~TRINITY_DN130_c0_g2_i3.p1  ORF type:complete len:1220 (+),score=416.77 TRINITY_DN130_c0_g2_i3:36-3695(+)
MLQSAFRQIRTQKRAVNALVSQIRQKHIASVDGNGAAAYVAYGCSDLALGYPITPSSAAFELLEKWSSEGVKNAIGDNVSVGVMQSEGGVAGALGGALATGSLATTCTSSQGLMLMIPNLFKMGNAGTSGVIHVASRSLIRQIGTLFVDHSDIMACRTTGWGILMSSSVQEAHDFALAAHIATLEGRVPFLHTYDGFRTSHEMHKIEQLDYDEIEALLPKEKIKEFRERGYNTEHPTIRGAPVNLDASMQIFEAANKWFVEMPETFDEVCDKVGKATGRELKLFDYKGHPEAEEVIVLMGSAAQTAEETVEFLNKNRNTKLGVVNVHLFRPFSPEHLLKAIPESAKKITVLDRVRDYGAIGEPLYLDVNAVITQSGRKDVDVINGIYGLCGKDPTPGMIKAVIDNMEKDEPKRHFTVGVNDDVLHNSLEVTEEINVVPESTRQCLFWGMGADGTVGANTEAINIISHNTDLNAQGYFVFEAKKSGGWTFSHLRFGPEDIKSQYEIQHADYVACHNPSFLAKYPVLDRITEGGTFVLNSHAQTAEDFETLIPDEMKRIIADKKIKMYNISANDLAVEIGMSAQHINMIMQSVFFKLSEVVDLETAQNLLKESIKKNYSKLGDKVVEMNMNAVDMALDHLVEVEIPAHWSTAEKQRSVRFDDFEDRASDIVKDIFFPAMSMEAEDLPVSTFMPIADGRFPSGTTQFERRGAAMNIPTWDSSKCIQCNDCAFSCPHGTIRPFLVTADEAATYGFDTIKSNIKDVKKDYDFTIQIAPNDCMGCGVCVNQCPADALTMTPVRGLDMPALTKQWEGARALPNRGDLVNTKDSKMTAKSSQYNKPLFEFSGACGGCGQTPYAKLLTQLYGDRLYIANATGCSIIWSSHFPFMSYSTNDKGHGPVWGNSLFEDNAEYGYGMLRAMEHRRGALAERVELAGEKFPEFKKTADSYVKHMMNADKCEKYAAKVREWVEGADKSDELVKYIYDNAEVLRKPSNWLIGGDGWAYDIGFGGVDHVLATNEDINIIVLDSEVYSNTGGQSSKSSPRAAVTKFQAHGKNTGKKDLGMMAMSYGHCYVASVALGAKPQHYLKVLEEAESFPGTSLIIAYCPCIEHGISGGLAEAAHEQQAAVDSGYWLLYRFDPRREAEGKNPLQLDSKPKLDKLPEFLERDNRFKSLARIDPELQKTKQDWLKEDFAKRWNTYQTLAGSGKAAKGGKKKSRKAKK